VVSDEAELDRLSKEAGELRDLVRALSAALVRATAALPLDAALALARSENAEGAAPFRLAEWHESIEVTRGDVASEMALLWRRLPPRENA
jgi:hypothetical protein